MDVVTTLLRGLTSNEFFADIESFPEVLKDNLEASSELPADGGYGELGLLAWQVLQHAKVMLFRRLKYSMDRGHQAHWRLPGQGWG